MLPASKEAAQCRICVYTPADLYFINFLNSKLFPKVHGPGGLKQNSGSFSESIHFHFQKAGKDTFLKINVGFFAFFFLVGVRHP